MEAISYPINHQQIPKESYQLISKKEAASLLSISTRTLDRLISSGELPQPIKVGKSSRIRLIDITQFIDKAISH
jgi:excisionase family DNA binding protein